MQNKKIIFGVVGVIVLVGVFYGGMVYGKGQTPVRAPSMQAFGQNGVGGVRGGRNMMGGFTAGEIIGKDAKSITVKIMAEPNGANLSTGAGQGGSKIIFLDASTTVSKTISGSVTDLINGEQVSITGTPNSDGSITAKSIQIRPQTRPTTQTQ